MRRISSASISARRTMGMRCASAASTSGLPRLTAVEVTTTATLDIRGFMPDRDLDPALAESLDDITIGNVAALPPDSRGCASPRRSRHADAADADEVDDADVGRDSAHQASPARVAAMLPATAARARAPTRITSIIGGAAKDSTRSARSRVASGSPQPAAPRPPLRAHRVRAPCAGYAWRRRR